MTEQCPKNILDPVFSRWQTTEASARSLAKHLPSAYFFCVAIIQSKKSKGYCTKLAKTFLSLINTRTVPELDETVDSEDADIDQRLDEMEQEADTLIESETEDRNLDQLKLQPGQTPILYAQLLFIVGFCDYFQTDHFEWLKKNDPFFVKKSFGYLARYVPERLAVMHFDLCRLEKNDHTGYKDLPQFAPFIESLDGIHAGSVKSFGKDYFEKAAKLFIEIYRKGYDKHMGMMWLTADKWHYLFGGDEFIARSAARLVVHLDDNAGVEVDDDAVADPYHFDDETIVLEEFHNTSRGPIELNLRATMDYLVSKVDVSAILDNPFVKDNMDMIQTLAHAEQPIKLFDITKASWGGLDLTAFQKKYAKKVCIHPHHQQICESYVNCVSLVSQTRVSEVRRQDRLEVVAGLQRPATQQALQVTGKRRIQGADKARYYFDAYDQLELQFQSALTRLGVAKFDEMRKRGASREKQSDRERKANLDAFVAGLDRPRTITKAEMPTSLELTAAMGGLAILRLLSKKHDTALNGLVTRAVHAELVARGIILTEEETSTLSLRDRVHKIRRDEYLKLKAEKDGIKDETKVSSVCPESDELRAFLTEHQEALLNSYDDV